jgi:hypothetical protein
MDSSMFKTSLPRRLVSQGFARRGSPGLLRRKALAEGGVENACAARGSGGGREIRTPEGSPPNGFQDRRNRPLCHPSAASIT